MEKLGYSSNSDVQDVASMEAESAGIALVRTETVHPRWDNTNEKKLPLSFFTHHWPDPWDESNTLHLRRQGYGCCIVCNANSQWLFNFGGFLWWRKCLKHFSSNEKLLHDAFWEYPNSVVSL